MVSNMNRVDFQSGIHEREHMWIEGNGMGECEICGKNYGEVVLDNSYRNIVLGGRDSRDEWYLWDDIVKVGENR